MAFKPQEHLTDLRGKDYLEVKWRIVWFRDVHSSGTIQTDLVNIDPPIVKATVYADDGTILGTGHGSANAGGQKKVWTGREIEKAETAAIGRALAHAGFGTQFTGEDEGDNLADSPVETTPKATPRQAAPAATANGDSGAGEHFANPGELLTHAKETYNLTRAQLVKLVQTEDLAHLIKQRTIAQFDEFLLSSQAVPG